MELETIIKFNIQNEQETKEAITTAIKNNIKKLQPNSNMFFADCVEILTKNNFYYLNGFFIKK